MKRRGNKSRRAGGRKPPRVGNQLIPHPPPIPDMGTVRNVRMRFLATSAVQQAITYADLLDTIGVAVTAILGYDVYTAVRIRSVELWACSVLGTATTVSLVYDGAVAGFVGDNKVHTDTSMGIEPAHLVARPQSRTGASLFQITSANTAFLLTCPSGTVVDVSLTFRNPILGGAHAMTNPLVGATIGALFYRGLDGLAISTTILPPLGVVQVA